NVTTSNLTAPPATAPQLPVSTASAARYTGVSEEPADGGGYLPPPRPASAPVASHPAAASGAPAGGQPPGGGGQPVVTLTERSVAPVVDLSQAGPLDWVHFGRGSAGPQGVDRRNNGSGAITDQGSTGPRGWYGNNPQRFAWHDGRPEQWENGTPTGV